MGIDFTVKSGDASFILSCRDADLKWRWQDINYDAVFDLICFRIRCLYDNLVNTWTTNQLEIVCDELHKLRDGQSDYCTPEEIEPLKHDIDSLITEFDLFVEHKCEIDVW
jgi:hypothetical protein